MVSVGERIFGGPSDLGAEPHWVHEPPKHSVTGASPLNFRLKAFGPMDNQKGAHVENSSLNRKGLLK